MIETLTTNGYTFSYIEAGTGVPMVFVHGSLLDHRYWQKEVIYFSDRFRAIALSRRYHWPTPPEGDFSYQASAQTEDVIAFLDALDAGPVHLIGHSYGGYIAASIAGLRPDLLRSLCLIEPGGPVEGQDPGRSPIEDYALGAELVRQGETAKGVAHFLDTVCLEPKWEDGDTAYQSMTLDNAITITEQVNEVRPTLLAEGLSKITCPTLLMIGARSVSPFPETLDRINALISHAEYVSIPDASHMVNIDNQSAFCQALDTFLASI